MMARVSVLAVLAVLFLACSASASRSRSWADILESKLVPRGRYRDGPGTLPEAGQPAFIFYKFVVPPTKSEDFVNKWNQYIGKPANAAQGNIQVHLNQPMATNAVYADYSEWETYEDFINFSKSQQATEFVKYAEENDIKWDLESFENSTGTSEQGKGMKTWKGKDGGESAWEVLVSITLKPSVASEWITVWRDAAQTTLQENGNLVYSLRRVIENNYKFYVYGQWESEQAWKEHGNSSHVRKLDDWDVQHDVVYFEAPLVNLDQY